MELRAVYVFVQLYDFFEKGLYLNRNATSVEARITMRMGTGHIFDTNSGTHMASRVWCGLRATYLAQV